MTDLGEDTILNVLRELQFRQSQDRHRFRRDPEGYLRSLETKLNQSALPP